MKQPKLPALLTPRQMQTLRFIADFQRKHHYSATIAELAAAYGLSRTTAFEHVAALREKKMLVESTGRARCLDLTAAAKRLLASARASERQTERQKPTGFPLLGTVSAGYGIIAEQTDNTFCLSERLGGGDLFVLRVSGCSMQNAGIRDKDYLVCRYAQTADDGQLVVAELADGRKTVKRFFKDAHAVRLQPENDDFEPIIAADCRLCAVVVGLVRRLGT